MNSSLDKLAKHLTDDDFENLTKEFGCENLRLLKQKGAYLYERKDSFERFNEEKLRARKCFFSSTKDGKIGDDGQKSDLFPLWSLNSSNSQISKKKEKKMLDVILEPIINNNSNYKLT